MATVRIGRWVLRPDVEGTIRAHSKLLRSWEVEVYEIGRADSGLHR